MSQWRRIAIERVPSCKRSIEEAENPMALWIELYFELEQAYETEPPQEETIHQIYGYAFQCLDSSRNNDLLTAVVCTFFEHLPTHGKVRHDLPNRISRKGFSNLEPASRYFLDDDEFKKFQIQFLASKVRYRKAY